MGRSPLFKNRLKVLWLAFCLGFSFILLRSLQLQLFPSTKLNALIEKNLSRKVALVGRRGAITDRNGEELAASVDSISIFVDPKLLPQKGRHQIIRKLSKVSGRSEQGITKKLKRFSKKRFVWIDRQLNHRRMKLWKKSNLEKVPGIGVLPEYRRTYPFVNLASQVLGFVSVDGRGLEGVERRMEKVLGGERLLLELPTDAKGRPIFKEEEQVQLREMSGQDVFLSLDRRIQYSAERVLIETIQKHEALGAQAIVMNPNTGEVLAMASLPSYDPNYVGSSSYDSRRNKVISDWFEPGSIIKPLVLISGIEKGLFASRTVVDGGGGKVRVGRKLITEADSKHHFDKINVKDVIKYSSNVGMVSLVKRYGFGFVEDSLNKLGFGRKTNVGLDAESGGLFRVPPKNRLLEQVTISYGHGIAVTPLQIARAYSVVANGGYDIQPTILKTNDKKTGERIFSTGSISQIKDMLSAVVQNEGTGVNASLDSVSVSGKTGTAWKVDTKNGGYLKGEYISSFVGYFPSEDPEYVVFVSVDRPKKAGLYGGSVAAPAFKKLAFEILRNSESFSTPILNSLPLQAR